MSLANTGDKRLRPTIRVLERAQYYACKRFMCAKQKTSNVAILGDCGRYPLYITTYKRSIKYWMKILKMPNDRLGSMDLEIEKGRVPTLSQVVKANKSRPPVSDAHVQNHFIQSQPENGLEERSEEFLAIRTDCDISFDSISPESASSIDCIETNESKEPEQSLESVPAEKSYQLYESGGERAKLDSGFSSQSEVVSISSNSTFDRPEVLVSPAKRRYRLSQEGGRKKVGSQKNGPGPGKEDSGLRLVQRQAPYIKPYPKWMNIPLREVLEQQGYYVDFNGKKHLLQVKLVPIENESETTLQKELSANTESDPDVVNEIFNEGSIDRPPDASLSLEQGRDQTSAVYPVASTQPSTNSHYNDGNIFPNPGNQAALTGIVSAPNIYGKAPDQPLDLTIEKPLDLSKKEKSSNSLQEDNSFPVQGNEEVNSFDPSHMDSASMNVRAETDITEYRSRCPSAASVYERESGDEPYDTDFISDQSQNYSEQNSVSDGNLPSLGRLTLECNSKSQNFAIQDSSVKQEIETTVSSQRTTQRRQQHIRDLIPGGQVSLQQLVELYCRYQLQKSANVPVHTSHLASVKHEVNPTQQQQLQPHVVLPQVDNAEGEQDIPTPAMPNLCSLELANTEGGIFETEQERVRNNLKKKLKQKQNM
ncbi:uncharacterized protein LOC128546717 [Mercenaria mercenaria]|uniref:uncharacterized protein LOC128546717 n=1 Tax=Mercenaria mercenaria TaxID=6596 RepID=UPI00234EE065|nr:uncharacterized protein LOC128546717 [Mercenaria mercenaria]